MVETEDRRRATTHAALRTNHGACGVESRRARGGARRGVVLVTEYEHEASRGRRVGGARAYGVERATDDDGGAVVRARLGELLAPAQVDEAQPRRQRGRPSLRVSEI